MVEKLLRTEVINQDEAEIEMVVSCDTDNDVITITIGGEIVISADWSDNMKQLFKEALALWG